MPFFKENFFGKKEEKLKKKEIKSDFNKKKT